MNGSSLIDQSLPASQKLARQEKIIKVLIDRIERADDLGNSHFSLFQSALALKKEVVSKSERLEEALSTLSSTTDELKSAYLSQERDRKILSDALEVMEEGFALFTEDRLIICNDYFRNLLPDVSPQITPGLQFNTYIDLVSRSSYIHLERKTTRESWCRMRKAMHQKPYSSFVISLIKDRWFQISDRRTSLGNTAILQTDITSIVRQTRLEKKRLIDEHLRSMQSTFDHLVIGVASFSEQLTLQVHNAMFVDLLMLPRTFLTHGVHLSHIVTFLERTNIIPDWSNLPDIARDVGKLAAEDNVQHLLTRSDGIILDIQIHALPRGGYIANIRDITAQAQAQNAMQQLNETLEDRVRERTAELSQVNIKLRRQFDELTRVEGELRTAKELAEMANASKTRFLAAASHDLLQPISAAKLLIAMLKDNQGQQIRYDYINQLDSAFNNVETLLHDLLDMSRLESDKTRLTISEFHLNDVFTSLDSCLHNLATQKGLDLRFTTPSYVVRSDAHYLSRILQNIIVNAIQNTEKGKVLVGVRRKGKQVCIEIRDTGVGIAEDDIERIFHEFTKVGKPGAQTGMGLGLSIVQQACRHLHHALEVKSWPGRGSLFRVTLNRVHTRLQNNRVPKTLEPWQSNTNTSLNLLIFLIENDPEVLFAATELLQHWGNHVIAVKSTTDAIKQYHTLNKQPHLLIVDYQLNTHDNGIQAIQSFREVTGTHLPVIMTTANYSECLQKHAQTMDFSIINKPVNPMQMKELIISKTHANLEETI